MILIGIIVILIGLWKKNVVSSIFSLWFILWIIQIVPRDIYNNNDYAAYYAAYQNPDATSMEYGFIYILKSLSSLGFSFDQSRWFLLSIVAISFWIVFRWISKEWSLVLLGYLFSTFFIDQVQLRNTIMWAFVFVGISFLLKKGYSKLNVVLFLSLVFIAGSIQSSGYIYVLILFFSKWVNEKDDKQEDKKMFYEWAKAFLFTIVLYYTGYYFVTPFFNMIQNILPIHFVDGYLVSGAKGGGQVSGTGILKYSMQLAIIVSVFVLLVREYERNGIKDSYLNVKVLNGIIRFNYLLIILISVNFNFFRLLRNEWIIVALLIVILGKYRKKGYFSLTMLLGGIAIFFTGLWWSSALVYTNIVVPTVTMIFSYIQSTR